MGRAWDVGILSMARGEKAILRCAPHYAYGEGGAPPKIPENAHLQFEVELLDWKVKPKEPEDMTHEERSAHSSRCKDIGNAAFKKEDWAYAIYAYEEVSGMSSLLQVRRVNSNLVMTMVEKRWL